MVGGNRDLRVIVFLTPVRGTVCIAEHVVMLGTDTCSLAWSPRAPESEEIRD
jgi:hypothetical protein